MKIILACLGLGFILILLSCVMWFIGVNNTEIDLSTRYTAQQKVVETTLDNMRKTLINQFKVNEQFANTYIECVAKQAEGREGGSLFKSVKEASGGNTPLGFTPELSMKMMNSIEGKMAEFKRAQDINVDVWREHTRFCRRLPNSLVVGSKVKPEPTVISSSISKEAMKTGVMTDDLLK